MDVEPGKLSLWVKTLDSIVKIVFLKFVMRFYCFDVLLYSDNREDLLMDC